MHRRSLLQVAAGGIAGIPWRPDRSREEDAETDSAISAAVAESDGFDPAVHGFGFSNWAGDVGRGADGERFTLQAEEVPQADVGQAIDNAWVTELTEAQKRLTTQVVYSWIGGNAATNGHCYGMAFSADDYFRNPSELPNGVDAASEVPRPTDEYATVGEQIRRFQTSQFIRFEAFWFAFLGLRWGLADARESLGQLTQAIDDTGTAGLLLDGDADAHQVLAHDYQRSEGTTRVSLYDPNFEASEYGNDDEIWQLVVDSETGEVREIEEGFDEYLYHDPEMELSAVDRLLDGRNRVVAALSNAMFFGLAPAGTMNIQASSDVLVDRPGAEYADPERTPYADAAIILGPPDEFDIEIDGEPDVEYSLDAFGVREGELALDEDFSGTLEEVPTRLRLTLDEAGTFAIDVAEEIEEEAAETTDTDTDAVADTDPADGSDAAGPIEWIGDYWWVGLAGGALGVGAAYRFLTERIGDEGADER